MIRVIGRTQVERRRLRVGFAVGAGLPVMQIVGCTGADLLDAARLELSRAAAGAVFNSVLTVARNLLDV